MTVDVDVYDSEGEKVDIDILPGKQYFSPLLPSVVTTSHISGNSTIKISTKRMEEKDKSFQTLNISDPLATQNVLVAKRLDLLKRRGRAPIIYHQVSANKSYSVLFMDMRVYTRDEGEYEDKAIDPPK